MKSLIPTDFPLPVAPATSKCGIDSKALTWTLPSIPFPRERLVEFFFICIENSSVLIISPSLTIEAFGLGIWIPIISVPGIGAIILSDFDFNESLISLLSPSIAEILIPSSGLILIWTIDGQISNPSIAIGTQNSESFVCKAFAFSTKKFSSTVCWFPRLDSNAE